jgi:hypothetical protein
LLEVGTVKGQKSLKSEQTVLIKEKVREGLGYRLRFE